MATIQPQVTYPEKGVVKVLWEAMGNADTGAPYVGARYADKTITLEGTWGSATIVVQGSNSGSTYFQLENNENASISSTADAIHGIRENTMYTRPVSSGGTGTDVDVILIGRAPC
jgi:hypothetical protein